MPDLTLITPTGGRPEAFALCEQYMARQTYDGELDWIVVDDCLPETECTLGQTVIRPRPVWRSGQNTQCRNLELALAVPHLGDKVLFIEDDDWYAPTYVAEMVRRLDHAPLVGEMNAHYYNVRRRCWHMCPNTEHSSLSQTGCRRDEIPSVRAALLTYGQFPDVKLFTAAKSKRLYPYAGICVGIKGLPGRPGIGMGHRPKPPPRRRWNDDPEMSTLQGWLGQDAANYAKYYVKT